MSRSRFLSHSIVRDELSFDALEAEWTDLFQRAATKTPFLQYSWLRLSWQRQRIGRGTKLLVLIPLCARMKSAVSDCSLCNATKSACVSIGFILRFAEHRSTMSVLVEQSPHTSEYVDVRSAAAPWVTPPSPSGRNVGKS